MSSRKSPPSSSARLPEAEATASSDPLLLALVLLYRRWWLLLAAAVAGGLLAGALARPGAPHAIADAQLYLKMRPVIGGGLQDPINAVAWRALLLSPAMQQAAGSGASLQADIEVTQDTNFGKHYSPVIDLRVVAPDANAAAEARARWRTAFLAAYGDLATRPAFDTIQRLEVLAAELETRLVDMMAEEVRREGELRPLLLARADLERLLAPFALELAEPSPARPRAQVQTRERVVAQEVSVAPSAVAPVQLAPAPDGFAEPGLAAWRVLSEVAARPTADTTRLDQPYPHSMQRAIEDALVELHERLADAQAAHRLAQAQRLSVQQDLAEVQRHIATNRLLSAGGTGGAPDATGEPRAANAFESADVIWLDGPQQARIIQPARSRTMQVLGAAGGALLAAAWVLLAAASRALAPVRQGN